MIPHTPLSFARHVTLIPAYREELHSDIRESFRRFEVERAFQQAGNWQAFEQASFDVERAAFEGRNDGRQLTVSMFDAATVLFTQIGHTLAVEARAEDPSAPSGLPKDPPLLECVYRLFYSQAFRGGNPVLPDRVQHLQNPQGFTAAWQTVLAALQRGNSDPAHADIQALMEGLAFEYANFGDPVWHICW